MTVSYIAVPDTAPLLMYLPGLCWVHLRTRHVVVIGTHLWGYRNSNRKYICHEMESKFGESFYNLFHIINATASSICVNLSNLQQREQ